MRSSKGGSGRKSNSVATAVSDEVCYCNGERELGTLELFCIGCSKWFHQRCLKDMKDFYGLPFMVCYSFHCKDCDPGKVETWVAKQANFVHMCVTVLANLTAEHLKNENKLDNKSQSNETVYFGLHDKIVPYFHKNWENLTSMPRRVKTTWHGTLQKTMSKDSELFKILSDDENSFALNQNLADIGPLNESVKQIGARKSTHAAEKANNLTSTLVTSSSHHVEKVSTEVAEEGPKTRGASKRRHADTAGNGLNKKPKMAADYSSAKIAGLESAIDFPFNKEGYRYFLVEKDPNVPDRVVTEEDDSTARVIPSHLYRIVTTNAVTISPNDRAYQLRVADDHLTVTGFEGYCVARATHSVAKGTWYYEVNFLKQPTDSHIRIGWSQASAVLQACVGYNKFSYSWRSLKGTKFHEGKGKKYHFGGFKEGDVLGIMIHLPHDPSHPGPSNNYLPPSRKDNSLINFKHNYFYEAHDEVADALKALKPLPGSKIEFFHNGKSCGTAFEDIYQGLYYPAVSLFGAATVRLNFGPHFRHLPRGVRPMSQRPAEMHAEQTLSDMLHLVERELV